MASRQNRTGTHSLAANGTGIRFAVILICTGLLGVAMACVGIFARFPTNAYARRDVI